MQGPCLAVVIAFNQVVLLSFFHVDMTLEGWASSLCFTYKFPERLGLRALEPRAGISGSGKPQAWVLPASPYTLFIPHTSAHTQMLSAVEFPAWTGRKECISRPTIARKIIQPGPIPRAGRPSCRPDQSPHPVTSDQAPSPAALLLSRNHPLRVGCALARLRGQRVKGPREELRERRPFPPRPLPRPHPHQLIPPPPPPQHSASAKAL